MGTVFLIVAALFHLTSTVKGQYVSWIQEFYNMSTIAAVTHDSVGNVYIHGKVLSGRWLEHSSSIQTYGGTQDIWTAKAVPAASGNVQWVRSYGSNQNDFCGPLFYRSTNNTLVSFAGVGEGGGATTMYTPPVQKPSTSTSSPGHLPAITLISGSNGDAWNMNRLATSANALSNHLNFHVASYHERAAGDFAYLFGDTQAGIYWAGPPGGTAYRPEIALYCMKIQIATGDITFWSARFANPGTDPLVLASVAYDNLAAPNEVYFVGYFKASSSQCLIMDQIAAGGCIRSGTNTPYVAFISKFASGGTSGNPNHVWGRAFGKGGWYFSSVAYNADDTLWVAGGTTNVALDLSEPCITERLGSPDAASFVAQFRDDGSATTCLYFQTYGSPASKFVDLIVYPRTGALPYNVTVVGEDPAYSDFFYGHCPRCRITGSAGWESNLVVFNLAVTSNTVPYQRDVSWSLNFPHLGLIDDTIGSAPLYSGMGTRIDYVEPQWLVIGAYVQAHSIGVLAATAPYALPSSTLVINALKYPKQYAVLMGIGLNATDASFPTIIPQPASSSSSAMASSSWVYSDASSADAIIIQGDSGSSSSTITYIAIAMAILFTGMAVAFLYCVFRRRKKKQAARDNQAKLMELSTGSVMASIVSVTHNRDPAVSVTVTPPLGADISTDVSLAEEGQAPTSPNYIAYPSPPPFPNTPRRPYSHSTPRSGNRAFSYGGGLASRGGGGGAIVPPPPSPFLAQHATPPPPPPTTPLHRTSTPRVQPPPPAGPPPPLHPFSPTYLGSTASTSEGQPMDTRSTVSTLTATQSSGFLGSASLGSIDETRPGVGPPMEFSPRGTVPLPSNLQTPASDEDMFLASFPDRVTTQDLNEYFLFVHSLRDRAKAKDVLSAYLHPFTLQSNMPQFLRFTETDNLQRWVFPFLFRGGIGGGSNAETLASMMSIGMSGEQSIIEMAMVQIVNAHFAQFIAQQPQATSAAVGTSEQQKRHMVSARTGLERTLQWLRFSDEWVWSDDTITFARLILFTFLRKLINSWKAMESFDEPPWKNIVEVAYVVEMFVFATPAAAPTDKRLQAVPWADAKPGLHVDISGLHDAVLVADLVKLLGKAQTGLKRNTLEPVPKPQAEMLKWFSQEIDFFNSVFKFFTDVQEVVDAKIMEQKEGGGMNVKGAEERANSSSTALHKRLQERKPVGGHSAHNWKKKDLEAALQVSTLVNAIDLLKRKQRGEHKMQRIVNYGRAQLDKEFSKKDSRSVQSRTQSRSGRENSQSEKEGKPSKRPYSPANRTPTNKSTLSETSAVKKPGAEELNDKEIEELKRYLADDNIIGKGSYGCVYRAMFRGEDVAVKVIRVASESKAAAAWEKEIQVNMHLRSPRLVSYIRVHTRPPLFLMITELMERGNLRQVLNSQTDLSFDKRLRMAMQIAKGLTFLHRNEPPIAHRDIKPENVLVDHDFNVKLSDFGLSAFADSVGGASVAGSALYMAPEMFDTLSKTPRFATLNSPKAAAIDSISPGAASSMSGTAASGSSPGDHFQLTRLLQADIYSFGILLIELFGFSAPWKDKTLVQLMQAHLHGESRIIPAQIEPVALQIIIGGCLAGNVARRPTIQELTSQLEGLQDIANQEAQIAEEE